MEKDRMHALLDRWRDIVRRSIAALLMLGSQSGSPRRSPFTGTPPKVDLGLVRRDTRDAWHERIVGSATAYGLPLLAVDAPPLVDTLHVERQSAQQRPSE
jgi:hypothetical protein